MSRVFLYTKDDCPYCDRQRELVRGEGVRVVEVNLSQEPQSMTELLKLTDGRPIVPVIVRGSVVSVAPEGGSEI